ncbi:hypothetical protein DP44_1797 [Burkholderia pseudomallei]|nr:hypothetical protein DP44_1797 [Burkholderia pseudomallei]
MVWQQIGRELGARAVKVTVVDPESWGRTLRKRSERRPMHSIITWNIRDGHRYFCSKSPRNSDPGLTAETCN